MRSMLVKWLGKDGAMWLCLSYQCQYNVEHMAFDLLQTPRFLDTAAVP